MLARRLIMFRAKIDCWDEREDFPVPTVVALGEEGERKPDF